MSSDVFHVYTAIVTCQRPLPSSFLKTGSPNLLVVPSGSYHIHYFSRTSKEYYYPKLKSHIIVVTFFADMVLTTTLALYMDPEKEVYPLPTLEEVLVCSRNTTAEEVHACYFGNRIRCVVAGMSFW